MTTRTKTSKRIFLCYKIEPCEVFPKGESDKYGCVFSSIKDAQKHGLELSRNPTRYGWVDIDPSLIHMWVTDENCDFLADL